MFFFYYKGIFCIQEEEETNLLEAFIVYPATSNQGRQIAKYSRDKGRNREGKKLNLLTESISGLINSKKSSSK